MTSPHRKRRGSETQTIAAAWFRGSGWPHAEPAGAGRSGVDITGLPGLAVEVKARRDYNPLAWLRQARHHTPGALPIVVHRPDGMGPATVAEWPVTMRLVDATALLRAAGYGDTPGSGTGHLSPSGRCETCNGPHSDMTTLDPPCDPGCPTCDPQPRENPWPTDYSPNAPAGRNAASSPTRTATANSAEPPADSA